jgi:hypothetical protein
VSAALTRSLAAIRTAVHPIHQLRRFGLTRALLCAFDRPLWRRIDGIAWPVRVRLVSHTTYVARGTQGPRVTAAFRDLHENRGATSFWDIGANLGFYSWLFKTLRPDGHVTLSDPRIGTLVEQTLRRSRLEHVSFVAAAAIFERVALATTQQNTQPSTS